MLTSLQRMIGAAVIWQNCRIGWVERAFSDDSLRSLKGIVVRRGLGGAGWLGREQLLLAGRTCVIALDRPLKLPRMAQEPLRRVYLAQGAWSGVVSDLLLDGETLKVCALEVSLSPSSRLTGRCLYAVQYTCSPADGSVTAKALLTWPQFRRQLGEEDGA